MQQEIVLNINESVEHVYASQRLLVPDSCNGYLAVNAGDAVFTVNNFPLQPNPNLAVNKLKGESTGLLCNKGEIFKGNNGAIDIYLDKTVGAHPHLIIVWKYYIP